MQKIIVPLSRAFFCYLLCEKNDTHRARKKGAKPVSAINTFPLQVTYSHVFLGEVTN